MDEEREAQRHEWNELVNGRDGFWWGVYWPVARFMRMCFDYLDCEEINLGFNSVY